MHTVMKPIEMIATFSKEGIPRPQRFKIQNDDESESVINVEKVLEKEKLKLNGVMFFQYRCQSCFNGVQRIYELIFEIATCKWVLYKI